MLKYCAKSVNAHAFNFMQRGQQSNRPVGRRSCRRGPIDDPEAAKRGDEKRASRITCRLWRGRPNWTASQLQRAKAAPYDRFDVFAHELVGLGDTTAPEFTPTVTGAPGSGGWFIGDANLTWTVEDPE